MFKKKLEIEYVLLSIAGLFFMLSMVILPVLSVEYGVMRAFQQSLIFLGLFIVMGSISIVEKFSYKVKMLLASFLVLTFFLSLTGVFSQILGGYDPQLHMNNSGQYYDTFYIHSSELYGIDWLAKKVQDDVNSDYQSEVQTDRFTLRTNSTFAQINTLNDIYPGLVRRDSYVYLGYANVTKLQASVSYNDSNFTYIYPISFLDDNKDLLYTNGGSRIYR